MKCKHCGEETTFYGSVSGMDMPPFVNRINFWICVCGKLTKEVIYLDGYCENGRILQVLDVWD